MVAVPMLDTDTDTDTATFVQDVLFIYLFINNSDMAETWHWCNRDKAVDNFLFLNFKKGLNSE